MVELFFVRVSLDIPHARHVVSALIVTESVVCSDWHCRPKVDAGHTDIIVPSCLGIRKHRMGIFHID